MWVVLLGGEVVEVEVVLRLVDVVDDEAAMMGHADVVPGGPGFG